MRDFFERQSTARRLSGRLAVILTGAALGTVLATAVVFAGLATILALLQVVATTKFKVDPDYWTAAFVNQFCLATLVLGILMIGMVTYKTWRALQSGGSELARKLGGTRVMTVGLDPQYRQLLHVVEELSIVTGATLPKVFVLEHEDSINGFAAGLEPRDTVVGVTRGALEHLDRAQLQGLLAHEFSHIVNGDVRINVQTLGALQGIEAIASAASYLLKLGVSSGVNGSMLATAFGCVLWPVGQIGVLFGSLARMALNRQREYLADAAAVQFARNPEGLSSALKLIAAHDVHGTTKLETSPATSHFFFAEGTSPLGCQLRSHPPIENRIVRLDPDWDGVLPTVASAEAAEPDSPQNDRRDVDVIAAARDGSTGMARLLEAGLGSTTPLGQTALADAFESEESRGEVDARVTEADRQAFLETLASVSASHSQPSYNPAFTHWPTLIATAAAAIGGSLVFSWFISR